MTTPAGAAPERLRAERIATAGSTVQADDRYAAYLRTDGDLQVLDVRGNEVRTIDLPAGCPTFRMGSGYVMISCGGINAEPIVHRLSSGARISVSGWETVVTRAASEGVLVEARDIGARWISVGVSTTRSVGRWYLGWRDGALVTSSLPTATTIDTLDAAEPVGQLCSPLERRRLPADEAALTADPFSPYLYDGQWGIGLTGSGAHLQRCGRARSLHLPCGFTCTGVQLGADAVSWPGERGRILELPCRRTWETAFRAGPVAALTHTKRVVLASVVRAAGSTGPLRVAVYRAARRTCP